MKKKETIKEIIRRIVNEETGNSKVIWNSWTPNQRRKFIIQHYNGTISSPTLNDIVNSKYDELWKWWNLNLTDIIDSKIK
jgi:hypothetical protein